MGSDKAQILHDFDNDIARIVIDKSYAPELINRMVRASSLPDLDPQTKLEILKKIQAVEKILADAAKTQNIQNTQELESFKITSHHEKEPSDHEKLAQKTKLLVQARQALFKTIKGLLSNNKVVAVNNKGHEEVVNLDEGLPEQINGFAGQDQSALDEVAKKMDDFCTKIPKEAGAEVRKIVVREGDKEHHFFAFVFPEGHNSEKIDLLAASDADIANSLQQNAAKKPNAALASTSRAEESSIEQNAKRRIGRTFSVVNGDPKALDNFHQKQFAELVMQLLGERAEGKTKAARLDGGPFEVIKQN